MKFFWEDAGSDGFERAWGHSPLWPALHAQFRARFKAIRQFKPRFTEALEAALAAHPEARVDFVDKAITRHQVRPPIARIA